MKIFPSQGEIGYGVLRSGSAFRGRPPYSILGHAPQFKSAIAETTALLVDWIWQGFLAIPPRSCSANDRLFLL